MRRKSIFLISVIFVLLITTQYQNCGHSNTVNFGKTRESLSSHAAGGGDIYDGKPGDGVYCRVFDDMTCQSNVKNIQSLMTVSNTQIQLTQDNCASTATNFLTSDVAVDFTNLISDYVGVTRGIFKKCEIDKNGLPLPPNEMPDAYCTSSTNEVAVVVNKNLATKNLDFTISFISGGQPRIVKSDRLSKSQSANGTTYSSSMQEFDLNISKTNSQTSPGTLTTNLDGSPMSVTVNCRQASSDPTVIIDQDMEISPTWIATNNLAGYWKLNEVPASEGTQIIDSSAANYNLTLFTGNDGSNKSISTVRGEALVFDGNDNISRASPVDSHLEFDTRSFSYMAWMKKTAHAGQWDMLIWKGGNCVDCAGYEMQCGTSGCNANISDGDGSPIGQSLVSASFAADSSVLLGRWVHLAVVVDRSTQTLRSYVDGALVDTKDISAVGSVTSNARDFHIGSGLSGNWGFLGALDDVAVWGESLSDAKIKAIFERLRPKFQ